MRRWVTAAVLGGAAALLLAACALPDGIDGRVSDDWTAMPEPVLWAPEPGTCHEQPYQETVPLSAYQPVDCGQNHVVETVFVGTFTGDNATRDSAPPPGSPGMRAAYADCAAKAKDFLGDDWRHGRLWLEIALPTQFGWSGGARWYRCELWQTNDVDKDDPFRIQRTGSLRDALRADRPVGYGCYVATEKPDDVDLAPIACDKPHNAEFAGVFSAPDTPYPGSDAQSDGVFSTGCQGVIAAFTGVPNDANAKYRFGRIWQSMGEYEWDRGNRAARCYLWMPKNVNRSLRGAGTKVLPVG